MRRRWTRQARRIAITACVGGTLAPAAAEAEPTEPGVLEHEITPWHNCSACHLFPNPIDIEDEPAIAPMVWQGSMMANAARDPVFWAGVAIASQDGEPGETQDCVRCHAPRAFLGGRGDAIAIDELEEDDFGGVSCDLCHRMIDDGITPPGNARYVIDDAAKKGFVPRRGPWTYEPGQPAPPHPWSEEGEFLASAQLCGTCHDVSTPRERVDDDGVPMGMPFNEQRTYSEWLGSIYADEASEDFATCQDCHMPRIENVAGCEMHALNGYEHETGRRHDLVGASVHMIGIIREEFGPASGGNIPAFHFDRSIELAQGMLAQAATLEVDAPRAVDVSRGLGLSVTVTNESGHKLPTGYSEGRVMWLEVVARHAGEVVWSSGRWTPEEGIEGDPQVRRYEAIAERYADGQQLHLLLNDHWIVDSRLPPRGLTEDIETDPVGERYALQDDGTWPHFDVADYAFEGVALEDSTPGGADELELSVRLLYLINTPEYVELLEADNETNEAGSHLAALFEEHGAPEPMVLAQETIVLAASGLVEPAGTTGGSPSGTTGEGPPSTESGTPDPDGTTSGGGGTTTSAGETTGGGETAGPAADEDGAGGCACSSRRGDAPWLLGPMVLLFVRRGRRRPR